MNETVYKIYTKVYDGEKDKFHINFELLSNAGINNDININMTFI